MRVAVSSIACALICYGFVAQPIPTNFDNNAVTRGINRYVRWCENIHAFDKDMVLLSMKRDLAGRARLIGNGFDPGAFEHP